MNIGRMLKRAARQFPDHCALVDGDKRFSFSQVDEMAARVARAYLDSGLRPGDAVGIFLGTCWEFVIAQFALAQAGLVCVPLGLQLTAEEAARRLEDCSAKAVVCSPERIPQLQERIAQPICFISSTSSTSGSFSLPDMLLSSELPEPVERGEDDLWVLAYTSGTTGEPKGVMHSHHTWSATVANMLVEVGPADDSHKILQVTPLAHAAGTYLMPFFVRGSCNVLMGKWDTEAVFAMIERERITDIRLVPTLIYRMLDSGLASRYDLSSLKLIIYGASPISPVRLEEAVRVFGPVFLQTYGQTDAPSSISVLTPQDHVGEHLASAGRPWVGTDVAILVGDTPTNVPRQVGEVVVKGPQIMPGYWNKPDETKQTLQGGWLKTGDIGYLDERGFVFLVDRLKDKIITGGMNVYPGEVERVLEQHPNIGQACVTGLPDPEWGECVAAFIVPKGGVTPTLEDVRRFCEASLAGYKKPRKLVVVEEIPTSQYGKPLRRVLRDRISGG